MSLLSEDNVANSEKMLTVAQNIRVTRQREPREYWHLKIGHVSVAAGNVLTEEGFEKLGYSQGVLQGEGLFLPAPCSGLLLLKEPPPRFSGAQCLLLMYQF